VGGPVVFFHLSSVLWCCWSGGNHTLHKGYKQNHESKMFKNSFYIFHTLLELDMESGKKKFNSKFGNWKSQKPPFSILTKTIPNSENLPHTHTHKNSSEGLFSEVGSTKHPTLHELSPRLNWNHQVEPSELLGRLAFLNDCVSSLCTKKSS
jgi:hypothetical protein